MDAFAIFEGGGAKGLAHVGALKVLEDRDISLRGVAGTSAGSIVAALVAANFRADEIYSASDRSGVFNLDFKGLFESTDWEVLEKLRENVRSSFGARRYWPLVLNLASFYIKNRDSIGMLKQRGGLLRTDVFKNWLNKTLAEKLQCDPNHVVLFRDLPLPLKIIATDVETQSLRVFAMPFDGEFPVADAVCASISIPFVFAPFGKYVDGGIMSNFPAWVFDVERKAAPPLTPTFGFRLIQKRIVSQPPAGFSLLHHSFGIAYAAAFGDNQLEKREVATLHEIPLNVTAGPLDFDMPPDQRDRLYGEGKEAARDYFESDQGIWRQCEKLVQDRLAIVEQVVRNMLQHVGHLRLNVMLPITKKTLQIIYTRNLDSSLDCDDCLQFERGVGCCGLCWEKLDYTVCNLAIAAANPNAWQLDKYRQALVRKSLQTVVSIPLYNSRRLQRDDIDARRDAFIGVLNIDSDDDLMQQFQKFITTREAKCCAEVVANAITRGA